jgi:hypothetical protein
MVRHERDAVTARCLSTDTELASVRKQVLTRLSIPAGLDLNLMLLSLCRVSW